MFRLNLWCCLYHLEPPTSCTNIAVLSKTDTTLTVRWSRPASTGRDDFFYRVLHSDPDNFGEFITENANLRDTRSVVTYTMSKLVPFTSYTVKVITHNGVSDQDPNKQFRICETTGKTKEGGIRD